MSRDRMLRGFLLFLADLIHEFLFLVDVMLALFSCGQDKLWVIEDLKGMVSYPFYDELLSLIKLNSNHGTV